MRENNFKIDSASISDRGLSKKRPQNEDSYLELNLKGLFAVADGVGGAQAGDVASQMAMEILGEAFNNLKPNEDAEELMKIAVERANSAIYQMSRDLPQLATMATTIVALHLSGNIGTIGHVGDSRLYRLDERGNLYRETHDHSVVEEEVRAGRMTVAQAANHPSRNIISRALGADNVVEVDMKTIMFEPNTVFLLCSDGITRHIDDFELRELLASDETPAELCRRMKDICYERGAEDNLTAVIAKVSNVVAGNGQPPVRYDIEESTIASSRKMANAGESSDILELDEEIPTQQLTMPVSENLPPIELDVAQIPSGNQERTLEPEPIYEHQEEIANPETASEFQEDISYTQPEETVEEPQVFEKPVEVAAQPPPPTVKEYESKPYQQVVEVEENTGLSKLLVGVFTLLIGMIIGAGAYSILMQNSVADAPAPVPIQKSDDIPFSEIELARRSVDANPELYLKQFTNVQPEGAEDFYLIGRANMLTGNFAQARTNLMEAKNRLGEVKDKDNARILDTEISMALAVIDNPNAQKMFADEVKKSQIGAETPATGTEQNLNINSGGNNQ